MSDLLAGFEREEFTAGSISHDIYRSGTGPAVIVISEIPGMTPNVIGFAERVRDLGCTAVLPHLFGVPGQPPSTAYVFETIARLCVSKEFAGMALGRAGPVMSWLRALARAEHERCGGPGVGVVGMCYTGGFGLAMAVDDSVVAPVLSQPSLPFAVTRSRRSDIQVSPAEWQTIQARADLCVIGLRFTGDRAVPPERFKLLREKLGDRFIAVELDSSKGNPYGHPANAHSVLTEHLDDRPGTPTREALDKVLGFLRERLLQAA
ncbi:MAG TPA: dienelactone hydrolase family protein [Acidimicrobiales bacterium]|nr:dienelactone hydrolase family protein [Acidimicrobiales bacterium]